MMRGYSLGWRECKSSFHLIYLITRANGGDSMILVSVYFLAIAHPGPIFKDTPSALSAAGATTEPKSEAIV